jgi:hypothetical protein
MENTRLSKFRFGDNNLLFVGVSDSISIDPVKGKLDDALV